MLQTPEGFAQHYSSLSDDELERLAGDVQSLLPEARLALRAEIKRRHVELGAIDWTAQPHVPSASGTSTAGTLGRFFRNFLIFLACDIPYAVLAVGVTSQVSNIDIGLLTEGLTGASLRFSLVLALWTVRPVFIPHRFIPTKLKTLWMVGFAAPPLACLCLLIVSLLHLEPVVAAAFWPLVVFLLAYGWWQEQKKKSEINTA